MPDPDDSSDERSVKQNCRSFADTLAPFGAVLVPTERTGDSSMQRWEDGDGEWLAVSQKGWPITIKGRGETSLSTWTFSELDVPMKLAGSWFYNGDVRQGLRAQALRCELMLTERAIRLGLSVGTYPKKGPWILDDEKSKMIELKSHCVFAAVIAYEEIEIIDGGKRYIEIDAGLAGLGLVGKIGRDVPGGSPQRGTMDKFATALAEVVVASARASSDGKRQAMAARMSNIDYAADFSRRFGTKHRFD